MAAVESARRGGDAVGNTTHDLYRRYGKQIYAYCFHRLRSKEEAEDAVQTTFMNAFRSLQRGASTEYEQAWLFKIAQNVCIARSTSSSRRLRLEAPNDFETLQETVPGRDGEGALELIGIEEALEAMPENQRRAILLREWQGLSYREIGEELKLSQAAVEMLIFRARRGLAGALEQPEQSRGKVGRRIGSFGSILGALKTLLGGGAAIKAAAVAAAAVAVVGEGASHTIVQHAHATGAGAPDVTTMLATGHSTRTHAATSVATRAGVVTFARASALERGRGSTPARQTVESSGRASHVRADGRLHTAGPTVAAEPPVPAPAPAPAPPTPAPAPAPAPPAAPAPAPPAAPAPQPAPRSDDHKGQKDDKEKSREPAAAPPPTTTTTTTTAAAAPPPAAADPQPEHGNDDEHGHKGKEQEKEKEKERSAPPAAAVPLPAPTPTVPMPTVPIAPAPPAVPVDPQPDHGKDADHGHGRDKDKHKGP